jgi:hypothetical protein
VTIYNVIASALRLVLEKENSFWYRSNIVKITLCEITLFFLQECSLDNPQDNLVIICWSVSRKAIPVKFKFIQPIRDWRRLKRNKQPDDGSKTSYKPIYRITELYSNRYLFLFNLLQSLMGWMNLNFTGITYGWFIFMELIPIKKQLVDVTKLIC